MTILSHYPKLLNPEGELYVNFSSVTLLDSRVSSLINELGSSGRAVCIARRLVPFFLESILSNSRKMEVLAASGAITVSGHARQPKYWHELQVWKLV